jgi:branched-subunit amino acid permease
MKIIASTILFFLLGTMFFSLFHMSMGMDMSDGMTNCPFMERGEVICPMNLADHMGAWKSVFLSVAPTLTLLLTAAGMAVFVVSIAPNLLRRISYPALLLPRWLRYKIYTFSYRPLQELFSSGILHPKLF